MEKNLTGRAAERQDIVETGEWLNFYGVVRDNNNLNVDNAIVVVFACFTGAIEKPLGYTFTDQEGRYFISIPKPRGNDGLWGYRVRAGKPQIPGKAFESPVNSQEVSQKEAEPDGVPLSEKECVTRQDNISDEVCFSGPGQDGTVGEVNFSLPVESNSAGPIDLGKAGESKHYRYPPEEVIFVELNKPVSIGNLLMEPNKVPVKKEENVHKGNEYNSTTLLLWYLACSVFLSFSVKTARWR